MKKDAKEILKSVINHFSPLTEEAWKDMSELFSHAELKKGEYLVEEGSLTSDTAFILEGVMRAFYRTPDGVEYNKTFFMENSFALSIAAALQKRKSYLNFQTLTDCKFLVADFHKIEALYEKHRSLETFVRKIIEYEWVIVKERRELRLVLNNAEERYLYFKEEYPGLENLIPQYHIASHLGITPIQLSRIRAGLSSKK